MSLLPPAMKITDPMPMTLGAAVKKALSQATQVDSIRAFEVGDWRPDSLRPPRRRKELTPAELDHIGECCTEAIQADEPKPRFKVGDRVRSSNSGRRWQNCVYIGTNGKRSLRGSLWHWVKDETLGEGGFHEEGLELIPSPKQEGQWVQWRGGECPIPGVERFEVRWRDNGVEGRCHALAPHYWRLTHKSEEDPIVAYRFLP